MQLIMSNPTEREMIRMRQDARNDWRTTVSAAERNAHLDDARKMKADGMAPELIAKYTGVSVGEIATL